MTMQGRRVFSVPSAGRLLRVDAPVQLAVWWPRIAPHVPGVYLEELLRDPSDGPGDLVLSMDVGAADARRLINAHLHLRHLDHGTLCLHAVALQRGSRGGAVLLLGGHGAGKSLVALALVSRGWRILAADIALLDTLDRETTAAVRGGSRAFVVRRAPIRRWFPELALEESGPDKVDLRAHWSFLTAAPAEEPLAIAATVLVDVDGDPHIGGGQAEEIDRHTAAAVWLRASGHLLDRMLEGSDAVLRGFENTVVARRRITHIRALAEETPMHAARGTPQAVADCVEQLASHSGDGAARGPR